MRITDGTGHAHEAEVTEQNELKVSARTESGLNLQSEDGDSFMITTDFVALTTTGSPTGMLYVKNNGETNIKVWFVVFSATQAGKWKLIRNPTAGTLVSAGTAITPVNLNTGSAKTLAITALKGADAQTVTNGSAGLVAYSGAGVFRPELAGSLLLSPGGSVAWTFQPAVAGDASVSLMVSQSIRSIHAKA